MKRGRIIPCWLHSSFGLHQTDSWLALTSSVKQRWLTFPLHPPDICSMAGAHQHLTDLRECVRHIYLVKLELSSKSPLIKDKTKW